MFTTAIPFPALDLLRQGSVSTGITVDTHTPRPLIDQCAALVKLGFMQATTTVGGAAGFRTTSAGAQEVYLLDRIAYEGPGYDTLDTPVDPATPVTPGAARIMEAFTADKTVAPEAVTEPVIAPSTEGAVTTTATDVDSPNPTDGAPVENEGGDDAPVDGAAANDTTVSPDANAPDPAADATSDEATDAPNEDGETTKKKGKKA